MNITKKLSQHLKQWWLLLALCTIAYFIFFGLLTPFNIIWTPIICIGAGIFTHSIMYTVATGEDDSVG